MRFNPFSIVARWWRRRRHKGLMVLTPEGVKPYDGRTLHVVDLAGTRPLRPGERIIQTPRAE